MQCMGMAAARGTFLGVVQILKGIGRCGSRDCGWGFDGAHGQPRTGVLSSELGGTRGRDLGSRTR